MDNFDEIKLFDIDIVELYDYDLKRAYKFIVDNTDYLNGISIKEVKEIKFSYYKDIIILLKNGELFLNGEQKLNNIRTLGFMSGISIFAFTDDNIIIPLAKNWGTTKFMNNKNYKYKKIVVTPLKIVALTYENNIRLFGTLVDEIVDYSKYFDVDDVGYIEDDDEIVVLKDNCWYYLFLNNKVDQEKKIIHRKNSVKNSANYLILS